MVTRPSCLCNGNTYTGKTTSLYWDGLLHPTHIRYIMHSGCLFLGVEPIPQCVVYMYDARYYSDSILAVLPKVKISVKITFWFNEVHKRYHMLYFDNLEYSKLLTCLVLKTGIFLEDVYRNSHCGDKTILRLSYFHYGISCTSKTTSVYWISTLASWITSPSAAMVLNQEMTLISCMSDKDLCI